LTLHGPGGAGKTRLALELAGRLAPAREHLFADLGALERAAPVWPSLVPLVEAREEPGMGTPDAVWTLSRAGRESLLRDSKGMRYLAALIAAGGRDVHVLELAGAGVEEPGAELLDDEARSAYRRRLAELEEEVDEAERFADPERLARLREEREALMGELARRRGGPGRTVPAQSVVGRARSQGRDQPDPGRAGAHRARGPGARRAPAPQRQHGRRVLLPAGARIALVAPRRVATLRRS
jgi:hypothetical protein